MSLAVSKEPIAYARGSADMDIGDRSPLRADVYPRDSEPTSWAVEAANTKGDGEVYLTVFYGPDSRPRALEYACAKYADVTQS